jgi:phage-related protein
MAGSAIATAYVQLVPTTDGIGAAISSQFTGVGDAAGKNMGNGLLNAAKSIAGPLAAAFSIGAVISFGRDSIQQASALNESANAIKVTFGEASGEIARLGETAATRLGLSQNQFNGIATQFSAFASTVAGSGGDVSKVIDDLTTRGADFASVMDLDVNQAMGIFQSGLAGETEPLRKYGIDLSAAAVEAYAMSAGIWDGVGTMTEAQKVQARYGSLMEQTSKVQGDFANTSDGLANSQRTTTAQFADAQAKLGTAFLPIMQTVTVFIADTFIPIIVGLGDTFAATFAWISENMNLVIPIIAGLGAVILAALLPAMWAAITATWAFTAALLANPITWIVLGIGALIAAIVFLALNWDSVVKWITEVWTGFTSWITGMFESLANFWNDLWTGIHETIESIWTGISNWFTQAVTNVVNFVRDYWGLILSFFIGPLGLAIQWIVNNWSKIVTFFQTTVNNIGNFFTTVFTAIGDTVRTIFENIVGFVKAPINVIIGLINGIITRINGISIDIPEWAQGAFGGAKKLGFNLARIPMLADGGTITGSGTVMVGERGPELLNLGRGASVIPLDKSTGKTVNYYAAPNESIDAEQALFTALKRAKVLAAW